MRLTFLGTGHWMSERRNAALYVQIDGVNILFDCPSHVPQSIEEANLPKPDCVFVTHEHQSSLCMHSLREISRPGQIVGVRTAIRGSKLSDRVSVRSVKVSNGLEPTVGYAIFLRGRKVLAYAPEFDRFPEALTRGALCACIDGAAGNLKRPVPPQEILSSVARCSIDTVLVTHVLKCNLPYYIPSDMEVLDMLIESGIPGVRLDKPEISNRGYIVRSSSVVDDVVGSSCYLCHDDMVYALARVSKVGVMDRSELRASGVMSDEERQNKFPGGLEFHVYEYDVQERYHPTKYYADPERVMVSSVTLFSEPILSTIKVEDGAVVIYSKDGEKELGRYTFGRPDADYATKEEAMEAARKRLEEIEYFKEKDSKGSIEAAEWSTEYINDLPDNAFLWIESGGKKDEDGKTTPRSLRHFPYKDHEGNVDLPHLRNAIQRIPQAKDKEGEPLSESMISRLQEEAREILEEHTEKDVEGAEGSDDLVTMLDQKLERTNAMVNLIGDDGVDDDIVEELVGMLQADIKSSRELLDMLGAESDMQAAITRMSELTDKLSQIVASNQNPVVPHVVVMHDDELHETEICRQDGNTIIVKYQ